MKHIPSRYMLSSWLTRGFEVGGYVNRRGFGVLHEAVMGGGDKATTSKLEM